MVRVKSAAVAKKNFEDATSLVPARYTAGLVDADWQAPSLEGQSLYEARMTDPTVLARRASGVSRVSDTEWRAAATKKGAPIIGGRMRDASDKQSRNWAPYRAALEAVDLPAKVADWSTNIDARLKPIVKAMIDEKASHG